MAVSLKLNKTIVNLKTKISYTIAYNEKLKYYCTKCWDYKGQVSLNLSVMEHCRITECNSKDDIIAIKNRFGFQPEYLEIGCNCEKCGKRTNHIGFHDGLGPIIRKLNVIGIKAKEDYKSTMKGSPKILFSSISDVKYFEVKNFYMKYWLLDRSSSHFSLTLNDDAISKKDFDNQLHYTTLYEFVDYYVTLDKLEEDESNLEEKLNPRLDKYIIIW